MLAGFVLGYLLGLGTLAVAVLAGKALAGAGKGYRTPTYPWKQIAMLRGSVTPTGKERT